MAIVIETESYNERRYGKPWIASVTFDSKSQAVFEFGSWIGEEGYKGQLELTCTPGDIVARGQKDTRKPRNSAAEYYLVNADNELEEVSKVDAYRHSKNDDKPTYNDLMDIISGSNKTIGELLEEREKLQQENADLKDKLFAEGII